MKNTNANEVIDRIEEYVDRNIRRQLKLRNFHEPMIDMVMDTFGSAREATKAAYPDALEMLAYLIDVEFRSLLEDTSMDENEIAAVLNAFADGRTNAVLEWARDAQV